MFTTDMPSHISCLTISVITKVTAIRNTFMFVFTMIGEGTFPEDFNRHFSHLIPFTPVDLTSFDPELDFSLDSLVNMFTPVSFALAGDCKLSTSRSNISEKGKRPDVNTIE